MSLIGAEYERWVTKQQAAAALGVTTKTIERLAQEKKIQQGRWQAPGGGPVRAVYHPDDIDRLARQRQQPAPGPFVIPAEPEALVERAAPPDEMLRLLWAAALRAVTEMSQTSETLFVTIEQAALVAGVSRAYLRRAIQAGTLPAVKDRRWRIRRRDLQTL